MRSAVVDFRIPKKCADSLRSLGYELIRMPSFSALPSPVSAHPDMLLFFADRQVFCHKDYFQIAKAELKKIEDSGYEIVTSDENISDRYPNDVIFNSLRLGKNIFGRLDAMSKYISDFAHANGCSLKNVKQGYAKCSVCPVEESAAITSDPSLCRAMRECGVDVLLISQGNVALTGYDTGFIGGASGYDRENIFFSGDITTHPDHKAITEFCQKYQKTVISLSDEPLYDIGSIFFI